MSQPGVENFSLSSYYYQRNYTFDAAFVRQLNASAWIPDANGDLQRPEFVVFDNLGWKPNPFLLSKIRFKPPLIEALAREAGIEPGLLDLLKKIGVTSEAELRSRLGIKEQPETPDTAAPDDVTDAVKKVLGGTPAPTPPVPSGPEPAGSGGGSGTGGGPGSGAGGGTPTGTAGGGHAGSRSGGAGGGNKRTPGSPGGRPFISYVGAHPDGEEPDPDGLDQHARMALEEKAIGFVLETEARLQRTPAGNPGYDLFEAGANGDPILWAEVKAMTGGLDERPVGLSRAQFDCARVHGAAYWLYVVEQANDEGNARIVRIQDPAGKARTFTFDQGWLDVAALDPEQGDRKE